MLSQCNNCVHLCRESDSDPISYVDCDAEPDYVRLWTLLPPKAPVNRFVQDCPEFRDKNHETIEQMAQAMAPVLGYTGQEATLQASKDPKAELAVKLARVVLQTINVHVSENRAISEQ